jgi:integrase
MPTLYKKTDRKPIPEGAEIVTRKGVRHARWTDRRGRTRTEPLAEDGTAVLVDRGYWVFDYQGPDGWVKGNKGYTDKEATLALAQRMERDAARAKQGLAPTVDPARAQTPYAEALSAWLDRLLHDNLDDTYVANMRRLVTKMAGGCGWTTLASIRADRAAAWLLDIKRNGVPNQDGVRKPKPPSDRTVDQYLESSRAFLKWCVASGYLPEDPLASVKKVRRPKRVRRRRAFSRDELRALLNVASTRGPVYRIAALTGLRKDELRQLQWRDCRLDQAKPFIQLRPEANKSRREDRVPLNAGAAAALVALRPHDCDPLGLVFPSVPTLETLQRDLRKAGISYRDAEGRQADFHSLRYTFCTLLALANVPIRTAMELMRHKDPRLTLQIYTDAGQLDLDEAVSRLPDLSSSRDEVRPETARKAQGRPPVSDGRAPRDVGDTELG